MEKDHKVTDFVRQLRVTDSDLIPDKYRITYETLNQ